jgi:hypothetical protein
LSLEEKTEQGRLEAAIRASIQGLMKTYEGRWFVDNLMNSSNLLQNRYLFDGDALGMAWRDGRASVSVDFLRWVEENTPDEWVKLLRERANRMKKQSDIEKDKIKQAGDPAWNDIHSSTQKK